MSDRPPSRAACPNCGAESTLRNPGIITFVCENCSSVVLRQEEGFVAGEKSLLVGSLSGIGVGSTGKVDGTWVQVVGRVCCSSKKGRWEEWVIEYGSGELAWLIEEEGEFTLERETEEEIPSHMAKPTLGSTFTLEGKEFVVRELGEATVECIEGQLPRPLAPGERFSFVDLATRDGSTVLSLEFSSPTDCLACMGEVLDVDRVDLSQGHLQFAHRFQISRGSRT